jgi:hypothetical protein
MVAEGARERRSKLARSAQASKAGQASGQVRSGMNVSDALTDTFKTSQPKHDTRAEIARETKVQACRYKLRNASVIERFLDVFDHEKEDKRIGARLLELKFSIEVNCSRLGPNHNRANTGCL